ncbi:MAG: phage head-tail connector protein [Aerococcus sp.]|nr:phage head-tail connector protein [Aerococcus sp.]
MAALDKAVVLQHVKEDLAIDDDLQDQLLKRLISKVMDHFCFVYHQKSIEERYSFIIEDCTIKRFNRRRAEGASKFTEEGYSVEFLDSDEFAEWDEQLRAELLPDHQQVHDGRMFLL